MIRLEAIAIVVGKPGKHRALPFDNEAGMAQGMVRNNG
jgi:hypothetical protein